MTFADLQDASGLAKSTTSRMLTALERSGLLERDVAGSYVAGRLFWLYAARHDPWEELVRLARPTMEEIGKDTGETVHLSVTRGDRVVQVAQIDSRYLLGTRDWTEIDVPAHCSALGKVFFAWGAVPVPRGPFETPTDDPLVAALRSGPGRPRRDGGRPGRLPASPHAASASENAGGVRRASRPGSGGRTRRRWIPLRPAARRRQTGHRGG